MKKKLYGIKKVFVSDNIITDNPTENYIDGMIVRDKSNWEEIKLAKPGSLMINSKTINGITTYEFQLTFSTVDFGEKKPFFKGEDMNGNQYLIGLGYGYMTVPSVEIKDNINDNANNGLETIYNVVWKNTAGRIFAE